MKKILCILTLAGFIAVGTVSAQSSAPVAAKDSKKEAAATPAANSKETPAACCHGSAMKACCKNGDAKNCTPEQRAACSDKSKAEVAPKPESK